MADPTNPAPVKDAEIESEETGDDEAEGEEGQEAPETVEHEEEAETEGEEQDVSARLRDVELENSFLKGERARRLAEEQAARRPDPDDEEEDDDDLPPETEIDAALRGENPAKYLRNVLKTVAQSAAKKATKTAIRQASQETQLSRIEQQDLATATEHYPELKTSPRFKQYRDQILDLMKKENGGRYSKGFITIATASAYGELLNAGELEPRRRSNGNGNGQKPEAELRREIRKPGLSSAKPGTAARKDPFEGFTPKERRGIEKSCKDFGLTPEQWRKSYDASVQERGDG